MAIKYFDLITNRNWLGKFLGFSVWQRHHELLLSTDNLYLVVGFCKRFGLVWLCELSHLLTAAIVSAKWAGIHMGQRSCEQIQRVYYRGTYVLYGKWKQKTVKRKFINMAMYHFERYRVRLGSKMHSGTCKNKLWCY